MKLKHNILLIIVGLFFWTCDDFLDNSPEGQVIPTTVADLRNILIDPLYDFGVSIPIVMSDDIYYPDYDEILRQLTSGTELYNIRAYRWEDQLFQNEESDLDWRNSYTEIFMANYVLSKIDHAELGVDTEQEQGKIKGWALMRRAHAYFSLVNLYGKHYNPSTSNTDLGVPIVLKPDPLQDPIPRSTVAEVYQLIEDDLEGALEILPDFPEQFPSLNYRPSKVSGYALLARIELYKGNWEAARMAAQQSYDMIMADSRVGFIPLSDHNGDPDLWPKTSWFNHKEVLWVKEGAATGLFSSQELWFLSDDLLNDMDPEDTRLTLFSFEGTAPNGSVGRVPHHTRFVYSTTPIRITAPNVPDVFLMLAETNARLDDLEAAESFLNDLRSVRIPNYVHNDSTNKEELLLEIIKERRIEHMYNGLRWFDIKRLNNEGFNISISHDIITSEGTETITLPAGDDRFVIQIPGKIISDFQPDLEQND